MATILHSPDDDLLRIDAVWMAVTIDDAGNEGSCAILQDGVWIPLMATSEARLEWLFAWARSIAETSGERVRIIKLTSRIEVEQIGTVQ